MPLIYNLQEKINEATSIGILILPEGQIEISQPVILPSNFMLKGNNTQIIVNFADDYAFKIQGNEDKRTDVLTNILPDTLTTTLTVSDANGFSIGDNIAISTENSLSKKAVFNTIKAISGNQLTLKNTFYLEHLNDKPIQVIKYQPKSNVRLQDLTITGGANFKTFGIFAKFTEYLTISNITAENIAVTPIHVEYSTFPKVSDSTFQFSGRTGFGDHSVGMVFCAHGIIRGNIINKSGGLYVKGSEDVTCSGNALNDVGVTGGGGVSFVSTFGSTIQSNTLLDTECYGIWLLNGSQNNKITDNHISDCLSTGIYLGEEPLYAGLPIDFNIISNNTCKSSRGGNGIFITAAGGNNTVSSNQTSRNLACGIIVNGSNNIITNNTSTKNAIKNIKIAGPGNIVRDNIESAKATLIAQNTTSSDVIEVAQTANTPDKKPKPTSFLGRLFHRQPRSNIPTKEVNDELRTKGHVNSMLSKN